MDTKKIKDQVIDFIKHLMGSSDKVMLQNMVGTLSFLLIAFIALVNLFFAKTIQEFIFDGLMWITLGCLAVAAPSLLKKYEKTDDKEDENKKEDTK